MFNKKDLILLWMAEGFLHESTISKSMERLGHEYFEELLSRSFFQHAPNDKSLFVMHDLMNDLATSIAGDFFSRIDIEAKKEFRKEALEKFRHMSLVCEKYMVCERFKAFRGANNLRTFLALSPEESKSRKAFYLSNKVLNDLLHELPLLRVLCLSNLTITEVPESIGSMKHLRYLNLSRTRITLLPDNVCNLYNLQTLIVFGCFHLVKLPNNFSKLKNLQHFDMRGTPQLESIPVGIGELTSLQTLSKFIIKKDNGVSLNVLKHLKHLEGKFSIMGLDKVQSPMHAQEANLSEKSLSGLKVEWSDVFDGSRKETLEKEVLHVLKPNNDSLKKLEIESYGGIGFPNWVGDPSFSRLTRVWICGCKNVISLPLLGQLQSLKKLLIARMHGVKVVGSEFLGTGLAFPSLEILTFYLHGWEAWSTNSGGVDAAFPRLRKLRIDDCPNLVKVSLEALPSLRSLEISCCLHEVLTSVLHVASSVTKLNVTDISGVDHQLLGDVLEYLGAVEEITIEECNEIRCLWESDAEASKVLVNLRILDVRFCSNLVSLGEKEDNCGSSLTSLRRLEVWYCHNLENVSCPNSIESLKIHGCDSITSVFFPTGGGQNLKSLSIVHCKKLWEKDLRGGQKTRVLINSTMWMLEFVRLSYFIHLTKLEIEDCQHMESFPDHELPNLTVLEHLTIVNCPSMDASFPRGLWPPKLCFLNIGGLKKPISEWGPQNFPTSLVELHLRSIRSEDVSNFSQLSHFLPSSLTTLHIYGFEKLESISMGLQHLTSLQHLFISKCPKTKDLPDKLLPTLLSLRIFLCLNLKKRCSRNGSYWPLISPLPCFNISE